MAEYKFSLRKKQLQAELDEEAHVYKQRLWNALDEGTIAEGDEVHTVVRHEDTCESIVKAGDEICDCDPEIFLWHRAAGTQDLIPRRIDADGLEF